MDVILLWLLFPSLLPGSVSLTLRPSQTRAIPSDPQQSTANLVRLRHHTRPLHRSRRVSRPPQQTVGTEAYWSLHPLAAGPVGSAPVPERPGPLGSRVVKGATHMSPTAHPSHNPTPIHSPKRSGNPPTRAGAGLPSVLRLVRLLGRPPVPFQGTAFGPTHPGPLPEASTAVPWTLPRCHRAHPTATPLHATHRVTWTVLVPQTRRGGAPLATLRPRRPPRWPRWSTVSTVQGSPTPSPCRWATSTAPTACMAQPSLASALSTRPRCATWTPPHPPRAACHAPTRPRQGVRSTTHAPVRMPCATLLQTKREAVSEMPTWSPHAPMPTWVPATTHHLPPPRRRAQTALRVPRRAATRPPQRLPRLRLRRLRPLLSPGRRLRT